MTSALSAPHFHNEDAAYAYVEARLWPNGPVCPHCSAEGEKIGRLAGKTARPGLRKCYGCRKQFTVKIGTIFEDSHAPLRLWLQAVYLICSSKKGISTRQLQRTLGVGMKTAWFMGHRIRHAMDPGAGSEPLGGEGKVVEADEAFLTNSPKTKKRPGYQHKVGVLGLVERGARHRTVVLEGAPTRAEVMRHLADHVHPASTLHTDGAQYYKYPLVVKAHESVNHAAGEYARKSDRGGVVHVNSLEGFFSVFKRGLIGVYQHVETQHLHRYTAEFDFRQNTREKLGYNDVSRADAALQGFKGKRLTYEIVGRN